MLGVGHDDVEHVRAVVVEHLLDGGAQLGFLDHAAALHAETLGDLHKVWVECGRIVGAADVGLVTEDGVAADAAVEAVFPLHDHPEVLVVQDHRLGRDLLDFACGELLHVHHERAVAVDVDDLLVGTGDLGAHRGRVAEAHCPETERADVAARLIEAVELRGPHLMLAHAGGDDRVALGELVQHPHRLLGHDMLAVRAPEGVLLLPGFDLRVPSLGVRRGELQDGRELVQAAEGLLHIGGDGQLDALVLVVLGCVDVDVDDLRVGREVARVSRDAVIEAGADAQQQVALVDRPVAVGGAVHAEPVHRERVRLGEAAHAHERGGDRYIHLFRERLQLAMRAGGDDAAARVKDGALRLGYEAEHLLELVVRGVEGGVGVSAAEFGGRGKHRLELRLLHVLRDVDDDGARPAAAGEVKGLLEDARQIVRAHREVGVLHDRQRHAVEISLLESHLADVLRVHLAGDRHHRDGVHERVGDRRHEVRRARAARRHANAHLAGGAGITLGRERPALLVAGQDHADLVRARQRLVQFLRGSAGVGEDDVDALANQALDDAV